MGEAHAAAAEDAYSVYWNPAGLASLEHPQFAMTYNRSFEGVDHQYLSLAYPLRRGSVLDFNLTRLGMTEFQGYDAQGAKTGMIDSSDYAAGLAYSRALMKDRAERPTLSVGLNLKGVWERLDSVSAMTAAADAGAIAYYRPKPGSLSAVPDQEWRLGLSASNLGPGLKFDQARTPLPDTYRLGLAWRCRPGGDSLTLTADQVLSHDERFYAAMGAEYAVFDLLALRMGYRTGQDIGQGFRGGIGFKLKVIELDYAFAGYGELGQMHRVGLTVWLGRPAIAQLDKRMVRDVLQNGKKLLREGRVYDALLEFDKALQIDPGNQAALEYMREANEQLKR